MASSIASLVRSTTGRDCEAGGAGGNVERVLGERWDQPAVIWQSARSMIGREVVHVTDFRGFEHVVMSNGGELLDREARICVQYKLIFGCVFPAVPTRTRYVLTCRRVHVHEACLSNGVHLAHRAGEGSR